MRARPLLLVALLVAGCTGGGPGLLESGVFESDGTPEISATKALEIADEEAKDWAEDAVLMMLTTAEPGSTEAFFPTTPPPYRMFVDEDLADGLVAQWFIAFHSPALKKVLPLVVAGDGQTARQTQAALPTIPAVGAWSVDSTAAGRIALRDANVTVAVNESDGLFGYSLARMGQNQAVWTLVARSRAIPETSGILYVDANTGERIEDPNR